METNQDINQYIKSRGIKEKPKDYQPAEKSQASINPSYIQWGIHAGNIYTPASLTVQTMQPGLYNICCDPYTGLYYERVNVDNTELIRFPDTPMDLVIKDIENFWANEAKYNLFKITHKRGCLIWGIAGGGKSSIIKLLCNDLIKQGVMLFNFNNPYDFVKGIKTFRGIQPNTKIVALMEDIDSILWDYSESYITNILDGVERISGIYFLASTNYPEKLSQRIINRPGRFDRKYMIGYLSAAARKLYFEVMVPASEYLRLNLTPDKLAADTENFSLAHMKELITSIFVIGDPYDEALQTIRDMMDGRSIGEDY